MATIVLWIVWFVFCYFVGKYGESRKLGFGWTFGLSLLFSPIVGLIIAVISGSKE